VPINPKFSAGVLLPFRWKVNPNFSGTDLKFRKCRSELLSKQLAITGRPSKLHMIVDFTVDSLAFSRQANQARVYAGMSIGYASAGVDNIRPEALLKVRVVCIPKGIQIKDS